MTFVGLGLHKRYITACALDRDGNTLAESRRMLVSLEYLGDFFGALPAPISIGM